MPNGDYSLTKADWEVIRAFFERHSHVLKSFAASHNLAIDEYYHDGPSWAFRFRHPKGGVASIHVERVDDSTIEVSASWFVDDFESFTRHFKSEAPVALPLSGIDLPDLLESTFARVLAYDRQEMTAHPGYKEFWSPYSKTEWLKMSVERFPHPKL